MRVSRIVSILSSATLLTRSRRKPEGLFQTAQTEDAVSLRAVLNRTPIDNSTPCSPSYRTAGRNGYDAGIPCFYDWVLHAAAWKPTGQPDNRTQAIITKCTGCEITEMNAQRPWPWPHASPRLSAPAGCRCVGSRVAWVEF